ncbi:MAG: chromosome segregation ATPase [Methanimicrococcus sp.]|nr:chromosome segregation ATPase [Methanimicrococcus sp.]
MIYTYQDGTELQVQRDFIQDLRNYIECLEKVLPLENDIIELKDQEREQTTIYERKVLVLSSFKDTLHRYVPVNRDAEEAQILEPCVNEIYNVCDKFIRRTREDYENEMARIKKETGSQIKHKESEIIKTLNPFLISSVYGAKRIYDISHSEQGLAGTLYCYSSGLQFNYKLNFSDDKLTVQKLIGDLNMPHMTKTGLFTKEQKPRMINLSDFIVLTIQYDDLYNFSLDVENKKRIIRIVRKNGNFSIIDDGQDITADADLSGLIEDAELQKIPKKIIEYIRKSVSSFDLKEILIDDEDAVSNNSVFDSMKIIAGQYGVIVAECIRRSSIKTEISIKVQMDDGARNEKYISKEELYSSLANIGGEGLEIASIIGADPKEKSKANNKYFIV